MGFSIESRSIFWILGSLGFGLSASFRLSSELGCSSSFVGFSWSVFFNFISVSRDLAERLRWDPGFEVLGVRFRV